MPGPKILFWGQFCRSYWQCRRDLKFSKFYPNHSGSALTKNWSEMVQEKQNYEKSFFVP